MPITLTKKHFCDMSTWIVTVDHNETKTSEVASWAFRSND